MQNMATKADCDSRLYDSRGNGTDAVHVLEQAASEIGLAWAVSEAGNGVHHPGRVLGRELYRQRRPPPYPHECQSPFLLL